MQLVSGRNCEKPKNTCDEGQEQHQAVKIKINIFKKKSCPWNNWIARLWIESEEVTKN